MANASVYNKIWPILNELVQNKQILISATLLQLLPFQPLVKASKNDQTHSHSPAQELFSTLQPLSEPNAAMKTSTNES